MTKRFVRVLLIAAVIAVGFLVYRWFFEDRETPGQLRGSGTVEITETRLAFQVPGRVDAVFVDEGFAVKRGQPLARLDSAELSVNLARAKESVAALQARLSAMVRGARPAEIAQAKAALDAALSQRTATKQQLDRVKALAAQGVASPSQLDQAQAAADGAIAQYARADETLRLVREGARREEIQAARAQLREARAVLDLAQTRTTYATITAPVDGVILVRSVEPGEIIGAGMPVLVEGDLSAPWLNVYVSEERIGRVKLGQKADVRVDSFPGRSFPAHVAYVSDQAEFTPKNVQTKEERVKLVFRVRLDVANPDLSLKPGMPADAFIFTGADGNP